VHGDEQWRDLVFRTRWWLDAVAPGAWDEVVATEDGRPCAQLAFVRRRLPLGLTALGAPPLTPWLGPWIAPDARDPRALLTTLAEQLPRADYFSQNLTPDITDWLPLYWLGYSASTRYTYVIDDVGEQDRVWAGMRDKTRNSIRKGEKSVTIRELREPGPLVDLVGRTFARQGMTAPVAPQVVARALGAAQAEKAGCAFEAVDADGNRHAVVFIVWDALTTYYVMGGAEPTFRNSQATSALLWHAIKHAGTVSRRFDFEGSMLPGVEPFFRGFGGAQVPYLAIRRASRRARVLLAARDAGRALLGRA
jgi:antitoxin (DNA-binding transcriptional repressor) of toxin-antitoxin stability system